jgi:TonB family protein
MTVLPAPKPSFVDLGPAKARATAFTSYFALIQAGLRSAFCKAPAIRTDASEIRVQLWIAPSGTVAKAELLASSGSEARDRDYLQALQSLAIGAPPASMPQPVTMLILPRSSQDAAQCAPIDASPSARRLPHE